MQGSGVHRMRPVCSSRASGYGWCRRACVLAVGGNGRVQMASDTWLMPEHQTLGVERPVVPEERPVTPCFA